MPFEIERISMPRRLIARCQPDSIEEFRAAARQRWVDTGQLILAGRGTAAIYLSGCIVEMLLKAAYFELIGHPSRQPIGSPDLNAAKGMAKRLDIGWHGNLHDLGGWSGLLVHFRCRIIGRKYPHPAFGREVESRARSLQHYWSAFLRYHKNVAYDHEVRAVRSHTEWFLDRANEL